MRRAALLVVLVACARPREETRGVWPALPRDDAAAKALVAARTRRPISAPRDAGVGAPIAAGWPAIHEAIRARIGDGEAWLLVGAHHDRATPIDAFRRIVGPESRVAWTRVAIEQLHADGGWQGMPLAAQRGESADVARLGAGDRDAYARLLGSQERDDYAAWKFGYVRNVLDVAAMPRVSACDAPPAVAAHFPDASRARLRELHCFVALDGELAGPRRVAMLWGDDHVRPDGFARFLPADARVVVVHVPREGRSIVVDPVLYEGDELTLFVPEPGSERAVDRVRFQGPPAKNHRVVASQPVRIDGRDVTDAEIAPGAHAIVTPRVIGAFVMPADGEVEIRVQESEPFLAITTTTP